jgi:hypothetical protein
VVTGAQLYDQWFGMRPSSTREAFCKRLGRLDPGQPIILYLCSSAFICPREVEFVRRWLVAVRGHPDLTLQSANVIVRPHPAHGLQWSGVSLAEFGNAVIWPPSGAAPLDEVRKQDYFDHLFHAGCVVGLNTSGFLEASIVGRRTLTVRPAEFPQSQQGTLHFRYLTAAGVVRVANDLATHLSELADTLRAPDEIDPRLRRFVETFLRPHGIGTPCTPILAAALQRLAAEHRQKPLVPPFFAPVIRGLALPLAIQLRRLYLARLSRRPSRVDLDAHPPIAHNAEKQQLRAKS